MIIGGVRVFMLVKSIGICTVARIFRAKYREVLRRAVLVAQGGEYAFVRHCEALRAGVLEGEITASMTAIVILSMALTPLAAILLERLLSAEKQSMEGIESASDLHGRVLFVGFGRFAQVVSQPLLARGVDVSIIEIDVEMIRAAGQVGFKVYYGDGTRLDVLRASGAERAEAILVCADKQEAADKIVALAKSEFPHAKLYVCACDRGHALRLISSGVDDQSREVLESAFVFGQKVLVDLRVDEDEVDDILPDVRLRDQQSREMQTVGGLRAGLLLMRGNIATTQPAPLIVPRREGEALNKEAAEAIGDRD